MARRKAVVQRVKDSVEERRWSRLVKGFERLAIKLKILISGAQILTALGVVFSIPYPAIYLDFLQV